MTMNATVIRVEARGLLVRNSENGQEVFVNFGNARSFSPGDAVSITYTGTMTFSIPPQITATSIVRIPQTPCCPQPQPPSFTEIRRARILRIDRNVFYVRDTSNQRQVIVEYPHAHHFCVGQYVTIRYETAFLGDQLRVIATDVFPIC